MTTPEPQPEPEPASTSELRQACEPVENREMRVQILFDARQESVPAQLTEQFIEHCCRETLSQQSLLDLADVSDLELSVQLLDSEAMRELNLQFRHRDSATNVLSFASEMPVMTSEAQSTTDCLAGALLVLGDLVLCPDVIVREAAEQCKPALQHWVHMLVHGTLHLCGYDHETDPQAQEMERIEIRILSGLGIPDPYAVTHAVNKQ